MRWKFGHLPGRRSPDSTEAPFRDELLGAQRLDDRARTLAARLTVHPRARARSILPRFEDNARILRSASLTLAADVRAGRFITSASEWVLDNFHLVTTQLTGVHRNLPPRQRLEIPPTRASCGQTNH